VFGKSESNADSRPLGIQFSIAAASSISLVVSEPDIVYIWSHNKHHFISELGWWGGISLQNPEMNFAKSIP
jgi:hypothetical protein